MNDCVEAGLGGRSAAAGKPFNRYVWTSTELYDVLGSSYLFEVAF